MQFNVNFESEILRVNVSFIVTANVTSTDETKILPNLLLVWVGHGRKTEPQTPARSPNPGTRTPNLKPRTPTAAQQLRRTRSASRSYPCCTGFPRRSCRISIVAFSSSYSFIPPVECHWPFVRRFLHASLSAFFVTFNFSQNTKMATIQCDGHCHVS